MTWGEFKQEVEQNGISDEMDVVYITVDYIDADWDFTPGKSFSISLDPIEPNKLVITPR